MNLRRLCLAAAMIALVLVSQTCFAQFQSIDKSRLGVGLSLVRPTGSQLKSLNSTWIGPVLDLHITSDSQGRPITMVSIGWFGERNDLAKASLVPVKLTYIKRFNNETRDGFYVGGSLDAYFATYQGYEYDPFTRAPKFVDEKGMPLGVSLLGGIEFGGAWYGEMRYDMVGGLSLPTGNSVSFSGLSLNFGTRLAF